MPRLQLEAGVFLCVCAVISCLKFVLNWRNSKREGTIVLDAAQDEGLDGLSTSADPFPITKEEDVVDGFPIQEQVFWRKVCC